MKLLKFIALVVGMALLNMYVPYGNVVNLVIVGVALWKLV